MALPSTGSLAMSQVNTELGRNATATISLGEAAVRNLAGRPSGSISFQDLRGKSAYTPPSISVPFVFGSRFGSCGTVTGTATASISNGQPPFSLFWQRLSGAASPVSTNTNTSTQSSSITISQFLCPGQEVSGSYRVTVSDAQNNTATTTFSYNLTNF